MEEFNIEDKKAEIDKMRRELLQLQLENEERIKCECISNAAMKEALKQDHPEDEINSFLDSIGRSLAVDRIYVFEDDFEADETSNTYEWCAKDVNPEIGNLQDIPRAAVTWWYDQFALGKDIHILDLEAIRETEPVTYSYLAPQGIRSLIAKRLMIGDKVIGFFGVDNPRLEMMADISVFLDTLSNFLAALIQNRNIFRRQQMSYVAELEEKNTALNEALRKAREANAAKSRFLSNMSHDIRTPMNAIIGMASIASDHIDDKRRVQDCLRKILLSGRHLIGLINDVLDMAKIESGKMTLNMGEISLRETMDAVCDITRVQVREKAQHFDIFIRNIISENVVCDGVRLNQVLLNLLSNAIKFTPEDGSVQVRLWQEESPKGADYVRTHFSVADTGMGMSPEFLGTIFEAFTREDAMRIRKTQGTGLGMAITKRIVDSMDGTIEVESELDKGSSFHVALDLRRAGESGQEMKLPPWNILVVDDNEDVCLTAAESLRELGARPWYCRDGETALRMVADAEKRGESFFAVIIDYRMPGLGGVETVKRIRNLLGEHVPIEMISAYDLEEFREEAEAIGVSGFISKPLFKSSLYHELSRYAPEASAGQDPQRELEDMDLNGMRILLAEDNDINAEIAMMILEEFEAEADRAGDGRIALELFEQSAPKTYDAILMDLRMPHMDGLEASRAIRALPRGDAKVIPIIAMTADAFSEDAQKCLEAGMDAHLSKPIDVDMLKRTLYRLVRG